MTVHGAIIWLLDMRLSCCRNSPGLCRQVTPHQVKTPQSGWVMSSCEVYGGFRRKPHGISALPSLGCWLQVFSGRAQRHGATSPCPHPGEPSLGTLLELHATGCLLAAPSRHRNGRNYCSIIKSMFYVDLRGILRVSNQRQCSRSFTNTQRNWKLAQIWIQTSSAILLVFQNQTK